MTRVRTPEQKAREYAKKKLRREKNPAVRQREAEAQRRYRAKDPQAYRTAHAKFVAKQKGDGLGRIYFIQTVSGPVKIGHTTKTPVARLKELQIGNHEELRLLGATLGTIQQERALHRQFATQKVRGEWFLPTEALLGTITALCVETSPSASLPPS